MLANVLGALAPAGEQLPEPGAEIGPAEHRVEDEPGEHEHQWQRLQEHRSRGREARARLGRKLERHAREPPQHPRQAAGDHHVAGGERPVADRDPASRR